MQRFAFFLNGTVFHCFLGSILFWHEKLIPEKREFLKSAVNLLSDIYVGADFEGFSDFFWQIF
jgi:hypothetical protein